MPDFLRQSLKELGVPGYKVFRWERAWKTEGHPFLDPRHYAALSVTTTGTHDTESLAEWWDAAPREERADVLKVPDLAGAGFSPDSPFDDRLRDALLATIYRFGREPRGAAAPGHLRLARSHQRARHRRHRRTGRGGCRSRSASC